LRQERNRRCLVTGGTGFVGHHLVACLRAHKCRVQVLTRRSSDQLQNLIDRGVEIVQGDIRDYTDVQRALDGVDMLFHLAGEKHKLQDSTSINIEGTRNLLKACSGANIRHVVHVSSVGVVGQVPSELITEGTPCRPRGQYERTKYASEQIALRFYLERKLPLTVIRPANVFGDLDPEKHLLTLMRLIQSGWFRFIGNEDAMLNYVYAGDVAEACWQVSTLSSTIGKVYIASDPCSLKEFVEVIAHELGVAPPSRRVPVWLAYTAAAGLEAVSRLLRRSSPLTMNKVRAAQSKHVYSSAKFRRECPSWPSVGWKEGIRRTIAWYRAQSLL